MARAYGANAALLGKTEAVAGTKPSGNWEKLPFISLDLGSEQPLLDDPVLGYGRDPIAPFRDVISEGGNAVVPMEVRDIGFWLHKIFGAATVTGASDPFTHTFKSGKVLTSIPTFALEAGTPEIPSFLVHTYLVAGGIDLSFTRAGGARATIPLIGQAETKFTTTQGGTPTTRVYAPFSQFQGSIKKNAANLASITEASLSFTNNPEAVQVIRNDGLADGVDPTLCAATGSFTARLAGMAEYDDAVAGTQVSLELGYTISATRKVLFLLNHVLLAKPKVPIPGPGGVEATFNYRAYQNPVAPLEMLTVTLINDIAAYT